MMLVLTSEELMRVGLQVPQGL